MAKAERQLREWYAAVDAGTAAALHASLIEARAQQVMIDSLEAA